MNYLVLVAMVLGVFAFILFLRWRLGDVIEEKVVYQGTYTVSRGRIRGQIITYIKRTIRKRIGCSEVITHTIHQNLPFIKNPYFDEEYGYNDAVKIASSSEKQLAEIECIKLKGEG